MYNNKMRRDLFILIFFATCSFAEEAKPVLQDIDYTAVIEQKMKLETKLENFVNGTLNEMLGPGKASVKLDITRTLKSPGLKPNRGRSRNPKRAGR